MRSSSAAERSARRWRWHSRATGSTSRSSKRARRSRGAPRTTSICASSRLPRMRARCSRISACGLRSPARASARIGACACGMRRAPGELAFDAAENGEAALGWIIENKLIQHALWQAVEAERNARLVCPAEVASVANEADGVEVTLADGTRLRSRVVIAADGAESPRARDARHRQQRPRLRAARASSRTSQPRARTKTPRGSVSCPADRSRSCRSPTDAARSCGRCRTPRPRASSRSTMRRSATSSAARSISGSARSRRRPRAPRFRCACASRTATSPDVACSPATPRTSCIRWRGRA